ncbi:MAG: Crp/Fnr family transcriptional regulator [Clostridia bacterium]|nr:Crp/Fnr family transcriptional regulator [Clostridia bacterium]
MNKTERDIIASSFFMQSLSAAELDAIMENGCFSERTYADGEEVMGRNSSKKRLIILIGGHASVYQTVKDRDIPVNVLSAGDVCGAASLFCENGENTVTYVVSKGECKTAELDEFQLLELLHNDTVLKNYLGYLVGRIRFLAGRMQMFAEQSTEDKLLCFLINNANDGVIHISQSYSYLAEVLSMGRASLYRAFDKLEARSLIRRDGKTVYLQNGD